MSVLRNRAVFVGLVVLLVVSFSYMNHRYNQLSNVQNDVSAIDFHDQFYEGKACGLLTTVEAAKWLDTPVGTSGSVSPADSPTAGTRFGSPRIDSCSHTAIKSSDGYIDLVLKTYSSQKVADSAYSQEIAKLFTVTARDASGLGQKLSYGDGAFYVEKQCMVIEISASKTPRIGDASTERFARAIVESILVKL